VASMVRTAHALYSESGSLNKRACRRRISGGRAPYTTHALWPVDASISCKAMRRVHRRAFTTNPGTKHKLEPVLHTLLNDRGACTRVLYALRHDRTPGALGFFRPMHRAVTKAEAAPS
jgi:hypothetical protein